MNGTTSRKAPAAWRRAGAEDRNGNSLPLAEPLLDVMAMAAVLVFPRARERCRELGGALLWADDSARAIVEEALTGNDAPVLSPEHVERETTLLDAALSFCPHDERWAVRLVERLAEMRWSRWLPRELRHAAERIERGLSVEHAARALRRAFRGAGVIGERGRASA